ncbi:MAG: hypothetical protein ABIT20_06115 [Gemmatimonadaceae bacterium]
MFENTVPFDKALMSTQPRMTKFITQREQREREREREPPALSNPEPEL